MSDFEPIFDFYSLLDSSAEAVLICDAKATAILWANRAAADAYGFAAADIVKFSFLELSPNDPRYSSAVLLAQLSHALSKDHHIFEWRIRTRWGDEFDIEASATYVTRGSARAIMIQFRDITERKLSESRLKRHELRFREFMQDLAEGVCIISRSGRIEYVSASASRLLGYAPQAIIDTQIQDYLDGRTRRRIVARFAEPTPEVRVLRYRIRRADGSWRWHDATYRYVELEDDLSGFLLHFRDITDRVEAEKTAREKEKMLEYLARHGAMGEMAAAIAHELSQPLAAAQNYIEGGARRLERDAGAREEVVNGLRHAAAQIDRATEIVRSIRGYVVKLELERENVDVNDILTEVRYFIELRARQMSVRVTWYLSDLPLVISCERVLIGQVVLNLAFNAIDAMVNLPAVRRLLRIATIAQQGYVIVRVEDRGRGLPIGRETKIFDGFFSSKKTGNGIGLSLCRNIVSKHGGTIWAELGKQVGAVFFVKLPLNADPTTENPIPSDALTFPESRLDLRH
jgi:two-component system sensor kinase FixL